MKKQNWQDWLVTLVGLWLLFSAWYLSFAPSGTPGLAAMIWNFSICGSLAIILGSAALVAYQLWEEWLALVLGFWLVISPWFLQYQNEPGPLWNSILSGGVILVASLWVMIEDRPAGHA